MSEEPTDEVLSSIGVKIQTMVQIATEAAITVSTRRAERARAAAEESMRRERQRTDRLRAELGADKLVMRRVFDDRWWRSADLDQIAKTWQVCASWANNDEPYGRVCLDQMREQIKARHGVDLAQVQTPLSGSELSDILGADREMIAGEAGDPAAPERSVRYVIRDQETGQELATGTDGLRYDDHRPIELIAAGRLARFEGDGRRESGAARLVIDVYDSARPGEEGKPTYTVAAEDAESVREQVLQRHERVLAGEEPAEPAQRLDALLFERQRIGEELSDIVPADRRFEAAREALAEHLRDAKITSKDAAAPDREPGDAGIAALSPEERAERAERFADLQERQSRLGLRIEAAEAEARGENGAHVLQAATLRRDLDEDWWQTASPREIQAVYDHVERWEAGHAKQTMLAQMQADISRHHGVDVGRGASAEAVGERLRQAQAQARGQGPAGREAEERRGNAAQADADAQRDDATAVERDRQGEPDPADAEHEHAAQDRAEAEQERDAAAALEQIEQHDAEAVNAVRGAAKSFRHSLKRRLREGGQSQDRRSGGSGRVLGRRRTPDVER